MTTYLLPVAVPVAGCHDIVVLMPEPTTDPTSNRHWHGAMAVGPALVDGAVRVDEASGDAEPLAAWSGTALARTSDRRVVALIGPLALLNASAATPVTWGAAIDVPSLQA